MTRPPFTTVRFILSLVLSLALLSACAPMGTQSTASTLDKIKASRTVTFGYRDGALPFSYLDSAQKPRGYSVELCERVAAALSRQLGLTDLKVNWAPVTADNRIEKLTSGAIDLECGTSSITLSRQEKVDFSLMTFVDGGTFLAKLGSDPKSMEELQRLRVAVTTGTTTEDLLRKALQQAKIDVQLVPVKSHAEGIAALNDGKADLYASDRTVLIGLALSSGDQRSKWQLARLMFSYEPYGLMMRRDPDFRLAVNRALAQIYRSGEIFDFYRRHFGKLGEPPELLKAMYLIEALPE